MRSNWARAVLAVGIGAAGAASVHADDRKFTYSYEAKTLPQGSWEWEQWATVQEGKESGKWTTLRLRDEIEYGVTDTLNGSIYLNTTYQGNNRKVDGFAPEHSFGFTSLSSEWKYKLTDPSVDPVGVLLYEELAFSNTFYEAETKLVLSKEVGPWTFAYNFVFEAVLNRADDPTRSPQWSWEYELTSSFGISYSLTPSFAVGLEGVDVARYDVLLHTSTRADYLGPNIHVQSATWWATLTYVHQVGLGHGSDYTDSDNTRYALQLVWGLSF